MRNREGVFVMEGQRTSSGQGQTNVALEKMADYKSGGEIPC